MTPDSLIRALRNDEDSDEVVRAVCDYALTGEPIDLPYHTSAQVAELRDMSRDAARRWCAEAIAARRED